MKNKMIVVIGAYGSGKSEYAINLARKYNKQQESVILVDLDVVNPYFRSRDVREKFAEEGIEVVAPEGEFKHADLPMLSPRIMGAVEETDSTVILDVGGDPSGCRTLARYVKKIKERGYEMHLVINTNRPFTSNEAEIKAMLIMLEATANLEVTDLICNTNLMEFTDEKVVEKGVRIIKNFAAEEELKFEYYLVLDKFKDIVPDNIAGKTRIVMEYFLSKPWEKVISNSI